MEEKSYRIKKAKIVDGTFLETEFTVVEPVGNEQISSNIILSSDRIIHNDLKIAFNRLVPHLAMLTEIVDDKTVNYDEVDADERFQKLEVRSFTIGGEGDFQGVTITGLKKLRGKKVLNLNTPFTKFDPTQETCEYLYLDEMHWDVRKCIDETIAYIEGKHGDGEQLELFREEVKNIFNNEKYTVTFSTE